MHRRTVLLTLALGLCCATESPLQAGGQNRDQQVASDMQQASREVVRTAPTEATRFESAHLILYIDKGLLAADAEQKFSADLEKGFVAASEYLERTFNAVNRGVRKPSYYLTNRAGISHAGAAEVFLFARRVIPSPAIAIHESVHLLLVRNASTGRNREDLSTEEEARLMATSGLWLVEGMASYVADELASRVPLPPARLFFDGDNSTVDAEARKWLTEPRGLKVAPFVGSHGIPEDFLADRPNVAAPFYVLGHSLVKFMIQQAGVPAMARLYEEHFDGTRSIEEDVKRVTAKDLSQWRGEWLRFLAATR
jgi:hypothetical protein